MSHGGFSYSGGVMKVRLLLLTWHGKKSWTEKVWSALTLKHKHVVIFVTYLDTPDHAIFIDAASAGWTSYPIETGRVDGFVRKIASTAILLDDIQVYARCKSNRFALFLEPSTCVTQAKRILDIRDPFLFFPTSLFRKIRHDFMIGDREARV